jgi:hypothetical protein
MEEDQEICALVVVRTPQGEYTLAGIDDYLNEVGGADMGRAASRKARSTSRKKSRYSKAKAPRKAGIAARVAARMAAKAGKIKKGFLSARIRKAGRIARRAARKGKSVEAAVLEGLRAAGLSKTDASRYGKRAIALLSGKKTTKGKKGKAKAPTAEEKKIISLSTQEENAAEASGEGEDGEGEGEDDSNGEDESEGEVGAEEDEFDEEYDSGPGGTEINGYGALPVIDKVKPFVPWLVLGLGALAIWHYSQPPATSGGADKAPAKKKR